MNGTSHLLPLSPFSLFYFRYFRFQNEENNMKNKNLKNKIVSIWMIGFMVLTGVMGFVALNSETVNAEYFVHNYVSVYNISDDPDWASIFGFHGVQTYHHNGVSLIHMVKEYASGGASAYGYPGYVAWYNHSNATGGIADGVSSTEYGDHMGGNLEIDSDGYIWLVVGAYSQDMATTLYRSSNPMNISSWDIVATIVEKGDDYGKMGSAVMVNDTVVSVVWRDGRNDREATRIRIKSFWKSNYTMIQNRDMAVGGGISGILTNAYNFIFHDSYTDEYFYSWSYKRTTPKTWGAYPFIRVEDVGVGDDLSMFFAANGTSYETLDDGNGLIEYWELDIPLRIDDGWYRGATRTVRILNVSSVFDAAGYNYIYALGQPNTYFSDYFKYGTEHKYVLSLFNADTGNWTHGHIPYYNGSLETVESTMDMFRTTEGLGFLYADLNKIYLQFFDADILGWSVPELLIEEEKNITSIRWVAPARNTDTDDVVRFWYTINDANLALVNDTNTLARTYTKCDNLVRYAWFNFSHFYEGMTYITDLENYYLVHEPGGEANHTVSDVPVTCYSAVNVFVNEGQRPFGYAVTVHTSPRSMDRFIADWAMYPSKFLNGVEENGYGVIEYVFGDYGLELQETTTYYVQVLIDDDVEGEHHFAYSQWTFTTEDIPYIDVTDGDTAEPMTYPDTLAGTTQWISATDGYLVLTNNGETIDGNSTWIVVNPPSMYNFSRDALLGGWITNYKCWVRLGTGIYHNVVKTGTGDYQGYFIIDDDTWDYTFMPGQTMTIYFTILIPSDAPPGNYSSMETYYTDLYGTWNVVDDVAGAKYDWDNTTFNSTITLLSETTGEYPEINITAPSGGEVFDNEEFYINWTATDNETPSNELLVSVFLNPYNFPAASSIPVASDIGNIGSIHINSSDYDNNLYYVWLWITDGDGNTNTSCSDTFTIFNSPLAPKSAPVVYNPFPLDGSVNASLHQTISVYVWDADQGDNVTVRFFDGDTGVLLGMETGQMETVYGPAQPLFFSAVHRYATEPATKYSWYVTATDQHGLTTRYPESGCITFTTGTYNYPSILFYVVNASNTAQGIPGITIYCTETNTNASTITAGFASMAFSFSDAGRTYHFQFRDANGKYRNRDETFEIPVSGSETHVVKIALKSEYVPPGGVDGTGDWLGMVGSWLGSLSFGLGILIALIVTIFVMVVLAMKTGGLSVAAIMGGVASLIVFTLMGLLPWWFLLVVILAGVIGGTVFIRDYIPGFGRRDEG